MMIVPRGWIDMRLFLMKPKGEVTRAWIVGECVVSLVKNNTIKNSLRLITNTKTNAICARLHKLYRNKKASTHCGSISKSQFLARLLSSTWALKSSFTVVL